LLKLISVLAPKEVVLNELTVNQPARLLILKGIIFDSANNAETVLTDFMKRLEDSSFILDSNLVSSRRSADIQQFEINCSFEK
jgi:hypothetical protein